MRKVILLAGPTAVGKTDLSLALAEALGGEIICADSMQIYRHMTIGTAKPTLEELKRCPHHLFDYIDPKDSYSVSDYKRDATEKILELFSRGKVPIITGGTGLYFNALMYQMDFSEQPPDLALRELLKKQVEEEGAEALYNRLTTLNPEVAATIHPNNVHRVMRAIEIASNKDAQQKAFVQLKERETRYDYQLYVLERDREELYERINRRVMLMVEAGLFEEVETLQKIGLTENMQSMKGIGYKEVFSYLKGEATREETISAIQQNSRHYAKRQLTWFRRYPEANWLNLSKVDDYSVIISDIISNIRENGGVQ